METDAPWGENPKREASLRGAVSKNQCSEAPPPARFSLQYSSLLTPWRIPRLDLIGTRSLRGCLACQTKHHKSSVLSTLYQDASG